jgi:hypothetical protein
MLIIKSRSGANLAGDSNLAGWSMVRLSDPNMNRIKNIFLGLVRLILVVAAPRFAFSPVSEDCSRRAMKIGPHSTPLDQAKTASIIPNRELPGSLKPVPDEPFATPGFDLVNVAKKEKGVGQLTVTYRGTVYPWQCDHMGHMNVMWYVGKFDEASWQLISKLGLTRSRFSKEGIGMVAVEQRIDYKRELRAGGHNLFRGAGPQREINPPDP